MKIVFGECGFWVMLGCVVGICYSNDSPIGMSLAVVGGVASLRLINKVIKD